MTRVCVVIPNLDGIAHLPDCLDALEAQTFRDFEAVIVDNGSKDGSVAYAASRGARVIELGENLGFPAACNAGIESSTSEYVVLLNNDTAADRTWLSELVRAMDGCPEYSWASSKLVRFEDPGVIDSAGHTYSLWVGAAHNVGSGMPASSFTQRRRAFGASAAAAIYRRSLFDDVGVLDAEFFLIHEDTEFDVRANVAGHSCLFVPDAVVRHRRGASYEVDPWVHVTGIRNRIWATRGLPPAVLVLWFATKLLRAFRWLPARLSGRRTSSRVEATAWRDVSPVEVLRATLGAMRSLPRKRREVRHLRRLGSFQVLRLLSETDVDARSEARSNQ